MKSYSLSHKGSNPRIFKELQNYKLNRKNFDELNTKNFLEEKNENCRQSTILSPRSYETLEFIKNEHKLTSTSGSSFNDKIKKNNSNITKVKKIDEKLKNSNSLYFMNNNYENINTAYADEQETSPTMDNNISFQKDNENEFSISEIIVKKPIFSISNINELAENSCKHKNIKNNENDVLTIKKKNRNESDFKYYEEILKKNRELKRTNQEYLKKIEILTKELNKNNIKNPLVEYARRSARNTTNNTKEINNDKGNDFYKELVEKYQNQCSLMAEEIISLRTKIAKINFETSRCEKQPDEFFKDHC